MPPDPINGVEPIILSPQRLASRLLTIGEKRIDLLMVEAREERERLLKVIVLSLGLAVLGLLAIAALTVALAFVLWWFSPLTVLLTLTALYCTASLLLYHRFTFLQRNWDALTVTHDQLKKNRARLSRARHDLKRVGEYTMEPMTWNAERDMQDTHHGEQRCFRSYAQKE